MVHSLAGWLGFEHMNTKDFLRLGLPLGETTLRAIDFVVQYVLRGGDTTKLEDEIKAIDDHD